ncbi:MAG: aminotransferase class I/II-fold pyridoxal phosphate-dependent enzyme [Patescibacteria group bacterium]
MKRNNYIRVPYGMSVHGEEEIEAVVKVLCGNTALGERTREFEVKIARLFGKKHGVMVNSGSSANLLAFELLDLPKGAEVITPILTFATTVSPIVVKGLMPVFVDVEEGTFIVNTEQVRRAITKRTRALMIPSLIGNVPNLKELAAIAKKHKLFLIEDSCDTLGASFAERPTGTYSHISTTSFYGSHIINGAGGGGMIAVNNPEWARRLVILRGWGRTSSLFGETKESEDIKKRFNIKLAGIPYDAKFIFSEMGYNFLPLEISSAFALAQLKKFPAFARKRDANFARLFAFFQKYEKFFILPKTTPGAKTNWLAFALTIREGALFSRMEICKFLEERNIQTRPVFTGNILRQPAFRDIPAKTPFKNYPVTDHVMSHAFLIGCHQGLEDKHLEHIENSFDEFLSKMEEEK